ncbi:dihydroorotate dehydrogenase [Candidatus Woesearchaeota archaeon]|nr:dihydroorotate dehydrogenase [Candidatus Woesearchaeota archaeon]
MISTEFCGIRMRSPTVLASGVLGVTRSSLVNVAKHGAGALTIKSISKEQRAGHNNPILLTYEAGMLNAVGYSNPGIAAAKEEFKDLKDVGAPVFASIIGSTAPDFGYMAEHLVGKGNRLGFSAVEIALSCPHTPGFGLLAGQGTPVATAKITKAVKSSTKLPVIVKLSPNIPNLAEVALAAQKAGADAINMGNTHGPGMVINIETRQPVLDFKMGGVSGPAIRPISVRCVYDLYKAVNIPIIGTGGVCTWHDAVEMIMAGATVVGVGSGVYYEGLTVFRKINRGIERFMKEQSYKSIEEMVGVSHG